MSANPHDSAISIAAAKPPRPLPPVVVAMLAQSAAGVAIAAIALFTPVALAPHVLLALWGALAAGFGVLLRLPWWWLPINLLFVPAAALVRSLDVGNGWFLAAFVTLTLLFWSTYRTQVPLFLSSHEAAVELAALIPADRVGLRVLDLGCGFGGLLGELAALRPLARLDGIEIAPLPAAVAELRLARDPGCRIQRGDFWLTDLGEFDVVYAFLSPVPMAQLWHKVSTEMRPGTLFVSNTFPVPGVTPDVVVPLSGRGSRALYVWRR